MATCNSGWQVKSQLFSLWKDLLIVYFVLELEDYVVNSINPTMKGFINKYNAKLAEFTLNTDVSSPQGYFTHWINEYNFLIRSLRSELDIKYVLSKRATKSRAIPP